MKCTRVQDRLPLYLAGELEPREAAALCKHLERCSHCTTRAEELAETQEQIEEALRTTVSAPATLEARVMAAVRGLPRRRVPWPAYPSPPVRLRLLATAAALCLLIGSYSLGYWQASQNHLLALGGTLPERPTLALARLGEDHREYLAVSQPAQIPGPDIVPVSRGLTSLVKFPVAAIDLRAQGARLLGGRKCQLQGLPIAFLLYDWKGERVSLYQLNGRQVVLPTLRSAVFEGRCFLVEEAEDLSYVAWHSGSREFVMVSGAPPERLLTLARLASSEPTF